MNLENRELMNALYHEGHERLGLMPNYYKWICSFFKDALTGAVVELGVGSGYLLDHYMDKVETIIAVDFNEFLIEKLKYRFADKPVIPFLTDLRKDWKELEKYNPDAVIALDVIEHFEDDHTFVQKMSKILRPGGSAIIKVPAHSRLFGLADSASGHYRRYDFNVLENLMTSNGFRVIDQQFFNFAGMVVYTSKRNKKNRFSKSISPMALKLGNQMIPFFSIIDKLLPVGGLSLIGRYQKIDG